MEEARGGMSGKTIAWVSCAATALVAVGFALSQGVVPGKSAPQPQSILLQAKAMKFNAVNPTLEVRRGVPVEITVRNEESGAIPHDFVVIGLDLRTPNPLRPGEAATLRFTPSRPGEFAYSCTLHPHLMDGRLVVRP